MVGDIIKDVVIQGDIKEPCNFKNELAGLFHAFYEEHRVVDIAEPRLSQARLALCEGVKNVMAEGLGLLGVSTPQEM